MKPVELVPDRDKAVEILFYVIRRIPDMYAAFKILYFATREHLHRYGSTLFDEDFAAMEYGPVPSYLYDVVRTARGDCLYPVPKEHADSLSVDGSDLIPRREPDLDRLSASERECLDWAIERNKHRVR